MDTMIKETHAALVFLLGEHAYKMKKPVNLGFLDFSTVRAREAACRREVELNRRLSPDVYEGVADVLGPDGQVCEHLVVMRQMPGERRLATLVRSGAQVEEQLRGIARQLAGLHANSRHGPDIDREGGRQALRGRWTESFAQVRGLPGATIPPGMLDEIERLTLRFLDGRDPLFAARVAAKRVVDGHGDLMAEDIFCLEDGPRILDCLEFDERLRFVDGLDDAAFLAMDLERLGAPRLSEEFLRRYVEFSGDPAPPTLWHHYVAYRAFVRAKVACLRHWQGDVDAGWEARRLAELTLGHLRAGEVAMIVVGGSPGTGKSTLSGGIADRCGYTVLRSDRIRKELAGLDPLDSASAPYQQGIYDQAHTERTYTEVLSRAEKLLGLGEPVVLDASWTGERHRDQAARVAARTSSTLVMLRCTVMPQIAAERLATRGLGLTDADEAIGAVMAATAAPWPDAVEIDTGVAPEQALERALAAVQPAKGELSWRFRRPQIEPG
ncbi:bifunctional aminoglycoside phosphotransferase/ATP-binding protein [Nonomuraea cavernae]|nr:AAA family ATPase [Nonomuraea cavernae]MCA2189522.1 AAA family ATPase [Nonomuraea cavernae]